MVKNLSCLASMIWDNNTALFSLPLLIKILNLCLLRQCFLIRYLPLQILIKIAEIQPFKINALHLISGVLVALWRMKPLFSPMYAIISGSIPIRPAFMAR